MSLIDKSIAPLKEYLTDLYTHSLPLWEENLSKIKQFEKITKIAVPLIIISQVIAMFFRGFSLFKAVAIYPFLEISTLSSTLSQFYEDSEKAIDLNTALIHKAEITNLLQTQSQTALFQAVTTNSLTYKLMLLIRRPFV